MSNAWLLIMSDTSRSNYIVFNNYDSIIKYLYNTKDEIKKLNDYMFYNVDYDITYIIKVTEIMEE